MKKLLCFLGFHKWSGMDFRGESRICNNCVEIHRWSYVKDKWINVNYNKDRK